MSDSEGIPLPPITIDLGEGSDVTVDPVTGATAVNMPDGSVEVDLNPPAVDPSLPDDKFDTNLAERISQDELDRISNLLLTAIAADEQSRSEWLETRAKAIDLLGFKIEEPRGDAGGSTAPVEGMSTVRHPLLQEAVLRFQANAGAELLPAGGPVKVRNDTPVQPSDDELPGIGHNGGPPLPDTMAPPVNPDDLAEALETDFNHYLTVSDKGYRSDTNRMLFNVGFGGSGFKKVYHDPIRRMPISRAVEAEDLIVSNFAKSIDDAGRVTHRIMMRKSTLIRMQIAKVYRKTELPQPNEMPHVVQEKTAEVQGFQPRNQRPEDAEYTIYECYCELDLRGYEHKLDGEKSGLELPYRVTIEKDTRQVLEIRRNWKQDDENCLPKKVFVQYPFVEALGFYGIGLLHILGNTTRALTAAWRLVLDAGMFASFPGFLYSDAVGRQQTNQFRIPPGGGMKIQTGNKAIGDVIMPLPYKDSTNGLQQAAATMEATGQRVGGTAEVMVAEGKQDAPVGTTLALIEQATKMLAAVHVGLHAAQAEEFQLLKERFREDPESFWRNNKKPAKSWEVKMFMEALDNYDIVPAADPNTPSHMHRLMKAVALMQLQVAAPGLYDTKAVHTYILTSALGIPSPQSLFSNEPPPDPASQMPPPDPAKMAELQMRGELQKQEAQQKMAEMQQEGQESQRDHALRAQEIATESADRAADRASREKVAAIKLAAEHAREARNAEPKPTGGSSGPGTVGGLANPVGGWNRPI